MLFGEVVVGAIIVSVVVVIAVVFIFVIIDMNLCAAFSVGCLRRLSADDPFFVVVISYPHRFSMLIISNGSCYDVIRGFFYLSFLAIRAQQHYMLPANLRLQVTSAYDKL